VPNADHVTRIDAGWTAWLLLLQPVALSLCERTLHCQSVQAVAEQIGASEENQ